jgi:protein-tyrosine-phosphatase
MSLPPTPLFLCHANCSRSVLASYLYRHLCPGASVLSAGFQPGEQTSDRALAMLAWWGIDAAEHQPTRMDRRFCDQASAIFVMAPAYLRRLLLEYDSDLATKAYLYADPFSQPAAIAGGEYTVRDPSFDNRPTVELVEEFAWMRDRTKQIRTALLGRGRPLIAAVNYLNVLEHVDPQGH